MNELEKFLAESRDNTASMASDPRVQAANGEWLAAITPYKYSYNYVWMGRPIIQFPQDMVAMGELIWEIQPDAVIETGIAHGGSLVFTASLLAMLDYCDAQRKGELLDPAAPARKVIGVDIDIRSHNREAIESHPMFSRIEMIEGSSIDSDVILQVKELISETDRVLVSLDSNHTHDHVLEELKAYAPLVTRDSYCVVFDTVIEKMPEGSFPDRPWDKGDNSLTAVRQYLKDHSEFEEDVHIANKLLITVAPGGFLKRTK